MVYAVFNYKVDRFEWVATLKELVSCSWKGFSDVVVDYGLAVKRLRGVKSREYKDVRCNKGGLSQSC